MFGKINSSSVLTGILLVSNSSATCRPIPHHKYQLCAPIFLLMHRLNLILLNHDLDVSPRPHSMTFCIKTLSVIIFVTIYGIQFAGEWVPDPAGSNPGLLSIRSHFYVQDHIRNQTTNLYIYIYIYISPEPWWSNSSSGIKWAERSLIIGTGIWVFFSLILNSSISL